MSICKPIETEAVEVCPYCDAENVYPNYNVDDSGFVVKCKSCGKEIFLCDECSHHEDNPSCKCDWCGGSCFRGICNN